GGVHFDSREFCCVVGEVVGGLHPGRVERAFPYCGGEGGGAKVDSGRVVGGKHEVEASARVRERQAGWRTRRRAKVICGAWENSSGAAQLQKTFDSQPLLRG